MIQSTAFNYIDVLDKAADASWRREDLLSNNIANVDTPGYKRKDLDFEGTLREELKNYQYRSLDSKVNSADLNRLNPNVYRDYANLSYRLDGNNVDIDTESVELASEQLKYMGLTTSISSEFSRMRDVIK